jgi:hypothetical protein
MVMKPWTMSLVKPNIEFRVARWERNGSDGYLAITRNDALGAKHIWTPFMNIKATRSLRVQVHSLFVAFACYIVTRNSK